MMDFKQIRNLLLLFLSVAELSCGHARNLPEKEEKPLVALGQLWGFLKYHHPAVAEGKLDWDAELIETIPAVMNARNEREWKTILDDMVDNLPAVTVSSKDTAPMSTAFVKADYGELFNTGYFNNETVDKLQFILDNAQIAENHYITINHRRTSEEPAVIITNEPAYEEMASPELPYRILALFRYWNIVNYFFPYRELCDTKWSEVLAGMLPEFIHAEDQKQYSLACMELIAKIDDSHGFFHIRDQTMAYEIIGRRKVPFETKFIEDKLVVTEFTSDNAGVENEISVGDIITRIDGEKVEAVVKRMSAYLSASNRDGKLRNISSRILLTNDPAVTLTFLQDGKSVKKTVRTYLTQELKIPDNYNPKPGQKGYDIIRDSIGYIYPANCKPEERESEIARIMTTTKGLIIDLRCYPSDYNATGIAPWLMKNSGYYCRQSFGNVSMPGYFTLSAEYPLPEIEIGSYTHKVVVMVNEYTQSAAEDNTFFYYLAPRVTIMGSTTAGANGAVFWFSLPGGIAACMTGSGMYYPDGITMQRVGIRIDEEMRPTIAGIKNGTDELLERAIEIVTGK